VLTVVDNSAQRGLTVMLITVVYIRLTPPAPDPCSGTLLTFPPRTERHPNAQHRRTVLARECGNPKTDEKTLEWSTILAQIAKTDGFDIPRFLSPQGLLPLSGHLLITF